MDITIRRYKKVKEAIAGVLLLENKHICDTAEHATTCLPVGKYKIKMLKDARLQRIVPKIFLLKGRKQQGIIRPGNGVYTLKDGSIIVGKYQAAGLCIHSSSIFERLVFCLRKTEERGKNINLSIEEI